MPVDEMTVFCVKFQFLLSALRKNAYICMINYHNCNKINSLHVSQNMTGTGFIVGDVHHFVEAITISLCAENTTLSNICIVV